MRLLLILLLVPSVIAMAPDEAGIMDGRLLIARDIEFIEQGIDYEVSSAEALLYWHPLEDYLQDVVHIETSPQAELTDGAYRFSWERPGRSVELQLQARFTTHNSVIPVTERILYPLRGVPSELQEYLGSGPITDQSPEIQSLARSLAQDKDDAYEVAFALADWTTTNIEYSLASLGQPAIQRSSEVLESRWGKCDEMTALFISLNRALGIPARHVTGYAYTDSDLLSQNWFGHGWAEIWLPEVGWIPFDMSYGEYGYLDAGHVKLGISADVDDRVSTRHTAKGKDFSIESGPLDIVVTPVELVGHYEERVSLSLATPHERVGFGSAILILATMKNNRDHYVATRLDLTPVAHTETLSEVSRNVLLKPHEEKVVPFLIEVGSDLDPGLRYDLVFEVGSRLGAVEEIAVSVADGWPVYSAEGFAAEVAGEVDLGSLETEGIEVRIDAPRNVSPKGIANVDVTITGPAQNITMLLSTQRSHAVQMMPVPATSRFSLPGSTLRPGDNPVLLSVTYLDAQGSLQEVSDEISVSLVDIGPLSRVRFWFEDIGFWIEGLFS